MLGLGDKSSKNFGVHSSSLKSVKKKNRTNQQKLPEILSKYKILELAYLTIHKKYVHVVF